MATVLGSQSIDFGQLLTPAARSVTVPVGATRWAMMIGFGSEGPSMNLTGVTPSFGTVGSLNSLPAGGNDTGVAWAHGLVTSSGSQTIAITWSGVPRVGPPCIIVWLSDVADLRDSAQARGTWENIALPAQEVDSVISDLVLVFEYHQSDTAPATPSGCTSVNTSVVASSDDWAYIGAGRLSTVNNPGATVTSVTPSARPYPGVVMLSYPDSGIPPPPRRRSAILS